MRLGRWVSSFQQTLQIGADETHLMKIVRDENG